MAGKLKVLGALLVGAGLLSRVGRARLTGASTASKQALQRRRTRLPRGVEEFPSSLVDKRHRADGADATAMHPVHGETPAEVAVEHYQEHPTA